MRQLVRAGVVAGLVATTSMSMAGGAQAAPADDYYYADAQGQYATIEGSVGSAFLGDLLSGGITLGELQASLDSRGLTKLNGFAVPDGVKSGARGDLANVRASLIKIQTDHMQSTAPITTGPAKRTYLPIKFPPIIDAGLIEGVSSAAWGDEVFGRNAPSRVVSSGHGDTGYLRLLDLGGLLGDFAELLPPQLQHPVLEVETARVKVETGTIRNSDGTHGLTASGTGGLAAVQIFGGASNGGISLGLVNSDTGGEKDTAGTRIYATGKPGKAGCDYVVPDTLALAVGSPENKIALSLGTGQRVNIPGGLGYIEGRILGQSHCETSADGTYAHATGAGVGLSFHLTLPGVAGLPGGDIGSFTLTLPDLDSATVRVPKGGIPPSDVDPEDPVDPVDPVDPGDDVDPPKPQGGPADVPTLVDAGAAGDGTTPLGRWGVPVGAGMLVSGGAGLALLRRRLLNL